MSQAIANPISNAGVSVELGAIVSIDTAIAKDSAARRLIESLDTDADGTDDASRRFDKVFFLDPADRCSADLDARPHHLPSQWIEYQSHSLGIVYGSRGRCVAQHYADDSRAAIRVINPFDSYRAMPSSTS